MENFQSIHEDAVADNDDSHVDVDTIDDDPATPVRRVRQLLSGLGLPTELVLDILELAEYYAVVSSTRTDPFHLSSAQQSRFCSALLYLCSPPLPPGRPGESWRMKSVTWVLEGKDQGWGGEQPNTFNGAYSWYEACIFRPVNYDPDIIQEQSGRLDAILNNEDMQRTTADFLPVAQKAGWSLAPGSDDSYDWHVQCNKVAQREYAEYTVQWWPGQSFDVEDAREHGYGDGRHFLRVLRPGDRVGLVMRAQYPGWQNHVKHASVRLEYDVR